MFQRITAGCVAVAIAATAVAACGGSSKTSTSSRTTSSGTALKAGKAGGKLTALWSADVDFLDPGQTYYTFGYMVLYSTNRPLYSFKPDDPEKPVPDLATGPPEISPDNKAITVHIKPNVKYAPPVNRVVKTADIKYAFERAFSKQVPNSYAGTYFASIVGTPSKPNAGDIKPISGIETPDDTTIVFHFKTASAQLVSQALVMPITVPVPEEYARKWDASTPSKYDQYTAFTGPYMVKNDPQTGKVTGRVPGKSIDIVRNPNWDRTSDYRPAYLDEVSIQEGNDDLTTAARRALHGSAMVCCDTSSLPAPVMKEAVTRYKQQIKFVPAGGTLYVALNTTVKPLDNINLRKAIVAASDRRALRLASGGAVAGAIANGWIPPGIPGFAEGGGLKQNADLDFLKSPTGNLAVAKKYMLAAKEQDPSLPIDANGKWTGNEKILTVAENADPGKKGAEVFQGKMEELGFKLNLRLVPADTMFSRFCQVPKQAVAICPNVGWFRDFVDPQALLDATFNGDNIRQQGNVNFPQLNVPAINAAMKAAAQVPVGAPRSKAWANVNHMIAEQAPAIPYLWTENAAVESDDVVGVLNGYYTTHDLSFTSLRQ